MTNKFTGTLNKLMTSTQYQNQEEVLRDLEVLREEYLALKKANDWLRNNQDSLRGWLHEAEAERDSCRKMLKGINKWIIHEIKERDQ